MSKSKEVAEEYLSSLVDLTVNSKPLINMLTMLADEDVEHAPAIVKVIEEHIEKVSPETKLPILYLIDSIIKNVSQVYVPLFTQNIVNIFVSVFEKVDERTRLNMYKLRQTWGDYFPAKKLYALDLRVKEIDAAWPVPAPTPTSIHFNPKFLGNKTNMSEVSTTAPPATATPNTSITPSVPTVTNVSSAPELSGTDLRDQLLKKQKILIELQQKKIELELMQTKVILEEQQKHANDSNVLAGLVRQPNTDDAVKQLGNKCKAVELPPSSVLNAKPKKTKIAPANTQIIEAVKSRDPRLARQQPIQAKASEVTTKEQEIFNRQLAMLKNPVIEQVVPVASAQRVSSESNAKGHITINLDRNRDRDKSSSRTKKQVKDRSKKESSPVKSKSKHSSSSSSSTSTSKESRSSRSRSSKSGGGGRSKNKEKSSSKESHVNSSSSSSSSSKEKLKTPPKNERSVSPGTTSASATAAGRHSAGGEAPLRTITSHIESSPSLEAPPPPIISRTDEEVLPEKMDDTDYAEVSDDDNNSKECKKERTGFKDLKGASKGRNYMRRNRESSASPQKEEPADVDLRLTGPPEKQPRLLYDEEKIADNEKSLVNASGKDVDFRLLSVGTGGGVGSGGGSPKKLPTDSAIEQQPPKKKTKTEAFDELFGNEDVDLRKMTTSLNPSERLPSPPPPPVISNGPSLPQIAAVAPLVVVDNCKAFGPDAEPPLPLMSLNGDGDKSRGSFDSGRGRHRRSWADIKVKPEAEVKPVSLTTQLEFEMDQRKDAFSSAFDSSEKGSKKHFRERGLSQGTELDRLGRPLLYNKLPNDPRARRESLGLSDGRDTDMRRFGGLMERDIDTNINVNMIVAQAEEQVRNGTMSMHEYNELIKQVIYVNEKQKMREAQDKGRQETRRSHQRSRRSPNRYGSRGRENYRHDDDRRDRRHYNDIDERPQMPWRNMGRNESSSGYGRLGYPSGSNRSPFDMSSIDHRKYGDRQMKQDVWEDDKWYRQMPVAEEVETNLSRSREGGGPVERTRDCVDIPPADSQVLELIAKDPMKSINIDGTPRDIRFYGDTAVVMLSWDDPKEISFEDGLRRVAIGDMNITCALNESYGIFMVNGKPHRIKLGAPTRELYIDGDFYEAHFGGPPVPVQIDGVQYLVQVEGPPPQVKIGKKRLDLICGRVNMIVDATAMLPLYLDAKPQRFDLCSRPYVFRFVNSLKTLLVNEVPVDIQFGGVCRQICGYGNYHFLRLSMLPNDVVPGCVQIINMENIGLPMGGSALETRLTDTNSPPLSNLPLSLHHGSSLSAQTQDSVQTNATSRLPLLEGSLDILTSLMSGVAGSENSIGFNYQVEKVEPGQVPPLQPPFANLTDTTNQQSQTLQQLQPQPQPQPILQSQTQPQAPSLPQPTPQLEPLAQPPQSQPSSGGSGGIPFLSGTLNINDLFQRLVASGIVQTTNMTATKSQVEDQSSFDVIDFSHTNTLKERYPSVVSSLYSGIQCSSCGVRFSPEETVKYSRHLDWHFRQNRREKDAARKMRSRKWYYDVSDWIQFEEIEDLEERAQSWFDTETTGAAEEQEQDDVKSVPAPQGEDVVRCEMCRDQFDTYYNEEREEWHLKPCIVVEDKYYHPLCYEDLMSMPDDSLLPVKVDVRGKDESGPRRASKVDTVDEERKHAEDDVDEDAVRNESLETDSKDLLDSRIFPAKIIEQLIESNAQANAVAGGERTAAQEEVEEERNEPANDSEPVIKNLLNELVSCIVYKEGMDWETTMVEEESGRGENDDGAMDDGKDNDECGNEERDEEMDQDSGKEEDIEVLANVTVEQKKNIIAVDLIDKLDDDDEETVYERRTPSPITLIPPSKIKQEPVEEMESPVAVVDQTYTSVVASIDGNVEMIDAPPVAPPAGPAKIKITFNKPIATEHSSVSVSKVVTISRDSGDVSSEETEPEPLPLRPKKPRIAERDMTVYLPCVKGTEVSGLCTIM